MTQLAQSFYLEADDVWVLQLLEQGDLPDGGGGHALLLRLQTDLFHGHDLASLLVAPLESQVHISLQGDSVGLTVGFTRG